MTLYINIKNQTANNSIWSMQQPLYTGTLHTQTAECFASIKQSQSRVISQSVVG